jgi:phage tail sheath protein FI
MSPIYRTPGVYIEEKDAFPSSAVPVNTNIASFIGYTQKAKYGEDSLHLKPFIIDSIQDFEKFFGGAPPYQFVLKQVDETQSDFSFSDQHYAFENTLADFCLYNQVRMFFRNGGSRAYITSVGLYESTKRIDKDELLKGLAAQENEEINLLLIPEAVNIDNKEDCYELQQQMLLQAEQQENRFAILDIYDGAKDLSASVIQDFRMGIGTNGLSYGAAYYPWLQTNITDINEISEKNILTPLPNGIDLNDPTLKKKVLTAIKEKINQLPTAGAIAGVFALTDNQAGVWKAPANVSINSVIRPLVNIDNDQQENLNIPLDGKAVNAIRSFPGRGILIWGARTLDGNNMDWRYVSSKRTIIMIEQTIKNAMQALVFEPNNKNTWVSCQSMVESFLYSLWQQGALAGASPEQAYDVKIGLGITMTPQDILEGYMRINVLVALVRPAEFIVLNFNQLMPSSS